MLTQLRYLKQVGIPMADGAQEKGRGNRVTYSFYELMEVAVAFEALRRGVPARLLHHLVERRTTMRKAYRHCYLDTPEVAYEADWVRSKGTIVPLFDNDFHVAFQGRFSANPGDSDIVDPNHLPAGKTLQDLLDPLLYDPHKVVIFLKPLMIPLLVYAAEAPNVPTGPKT